MEGNKRRSHQRAIARLTAHALRDNRSVDVVPHPYRVDDACCPPVKIHVVANLSRKFAAAD
jgi:hypothetical protein